MFLLAHLEPMLLWLMWMVIATHLAVKIAACLATKVRKGRLPHQLQQQVLGQLQEQGRVQAWGLDQGLAGSWRR